MTSDPMPIAFVLHMGANGLGITRSLGREGIPIVGVDFDPKAPGLLSRYCRPLVSPDPSTDPKGVVRSLVEEAKKLGEEVVLLPASDDYILMASRNRKELSEHFRLLLPSEDIVEGMVDKRRMYDMAAKIGIPIPRTLYPASMADLEEIEDQVEYPAFVKPCRSNMWSRRFGNKGFVVRDHRELVSSYEKIFPTGLEAMVQEIVPGPATNLFGVSGYFDGKGEPLGIFISQKIRQYPPDFGVGSYVMSTHNPEVLELGMKFYGGLGYKGMGGAEFKKDERNGDWRLMELNLRTGMNNMIATEAGINISMIRYMDLIGRPIGSSNEYRDGVLWYDSVGDLMTYFMMRRRGQMTFGDLARSWFRADCGAFYAKDDVRPALARTKYGLDYLRILAMSIGNREEDLRFE